MPRHVMRLCLSAVILWMPCAAIAGLPHPTLRYAFDRGGKQVDGGTSPAAEGTLTGGPVVTAPSPAGFSCAALDLTPNGAVNNYVKTAGDVEKLDALTEMTITFWINLRAAPAAKDRLVSDMPPALGSGMQGGWEVAIQSEGTPAASAFKLEYRLLQSFGDYANTYAVTSGTINADDRWTFVAITFDANRILRFYTGTTGTDLVQSGIDSRMNFDLWNNTAELRIGSSSSEPAVDRTPPAWLDDMRIYNKALTRNEANYVRMENVSYPYVDLLPSFFGLGDLPGGGCASWAVAVSGDGTTVVGQAFTGSPGNNIVSPYRWKSGLLEAPAVQPAGWTRGTALDVSRDGSVVVGYGATSSSILDWRPFRWEGSTAAELPELPGGDQSGWAYAVSADGSIVVGTASGSFGPAEGFWWQDGATKALEVPTGAQSIPHDISPDGKVVVGLLSTSVTDTQVFRWEAGVIDKFGPVPSSTFDSRIRISTNKVAMVGWSQPHGFKEAVLWRNGRVYGLGDLPGGAVESEATAVSASGSYIVGTSKTGTTESSAFVWDRFHGMRHLKDALAADFGLDMIGWKLTWATSISEDGSVIVGYGTNPGGVPDSWMARLPAPPAPADFDGDKDIDVYDVQRFAACVTGPGVPFNPALPPDGCQIPADLQGLSAADFDWDGDVDQEDFAQMQLCFSGENTPPAVECQG